MSREASVPQQPRGGQSIRRGLLMAFLLIGLLPTGILTVISTLTERRAALEHASGHLETIADTQEKVLSDWIGETESSLRAILDSEQVGPGILQLVATAQAERDTEAFQAASSSFTEYTRAVIQSSRSVDRLILTDADGFVLSSSEPWFISINTDLGSESWLASAIQAGLPGVVTLAGPARDLSDGLESLYFSTVIYDEEEQPVGVLSGRAKLAVLQDVLVPLSSLRSDLDYFLVRQGQQYVTQPLLDPGSTLASDEIIQAALSGTPQGESWSEHTWTDYRGRQVVGVYRWIEPLNMALVVKQDMNAAQAGATVMDIRLHILIGVLLGLAALGVGTFFYRTITIAFERLSEAAIRIAQGEFGVQAPFSNLEEVRRLSGAINSMTNRLRDLLERQEEMIRARTRQLEITGRLGHVIAAETDLNRLLNLTIEMIRDQLGHYHAQIFMLDDLSQYAVLKASTGPAGQVLLSRGHKLAVGSQSVIGQVTARGEPVLASDTQRADFWLPNPILPKTRAELAVPLRLGSQLIGALDVQSTEPETFDEETISALQTVADQLAVAIRNAQLFEEKEGLLSASLQLTQTLTRDSWGSYTEQRQTGPLGFQYDLSDVQPLDETTPEEDDNGRNVRLPIALRGEVIGELEAELEEGQDLSDEQKQFVGQVLERVALTLENARLFEQTQQSLMEANRLYQASQRIAAAGTVEELANGVVDLAIADGVDRITLLLLDDPGEPPGGRWAEVAGRWLRDPKDSLYDLPQRAQTGQPPLLTIEDIPPEGLLINDVDAADMPLDTSADLKQMGVTAAATFPLITGRRTIGWLILHSVTRTRVFSAPDVRFYQTMADQAATAIESLRLFEQTRTRARRLAATNEVSRAASSILNPDILLPMIVDRVSEAFDYYHAQIFLLDTLGEWAILRASTGEVGQELLRRQHRLAVGTQSVIGQVTAQGEPVIARDTDTDIVHRRNELLPNTRAEMAIPLKTGDRVIGALDVQSTEPNAFDPEARVILQSLADEIAVTLENAQLFQEIQERVAELTTVNLVSQAVSRAETLDDLYDVVTVQLMRTFGAKTGYLGVLRKDGLIDLPIFIEGGERLEPPPPIKLGEGITSHVIRTRQMILIAENMPERARELGARTIGVMPKSFLAVPLLLGDEAIGVISIQDAENEHAYDQTDVRQLTTLAAYLAVKIRNAELLDEAQQRVNELGFLFNVTRAAVAASDLDEALQQVAEILTTEIENAESAVIYLVDAYGTHLEPHAAVGYGREVLARDRQIPWGAEMIGSAAVEKRPIVAGDLQVNPHGLEDGQTRSAILVPLLAGRQEEAIGVLSVESTQVNAFGMGEQRLLETAAGTLTSVIERERLLEEITQAHERLKELDQLKSQFLANMSHELRTPLNSIIGFSRVMLKGIDGELNELQAQDLTTIYQSGQHLLGLINDILDVSKIEAGKMEIQPEYISLHDIIDGVMSSGKGLVKDKPIQIFKEVEANLPEVYGDPVRLRQVLLNLVSNAAKFTHEGSIVVRAARKNAEPEAGRPARVQVDVSDTGIGIDREDMGKLFEAFQQVDGSTTRQAGGTGLGLTISKQFIEMHGGEMWVESEVGVGSTFSFTVPLHPAVEREKDTEVIVSGDREDGRTVVLAVDDEPGVIDLYCRYLEKEGFMVVGLTSANDLMAYVRELRPAAIVLDLNMPGTSGWDALSDLKQAADTRDVPVIICSIDDNRERGRQMGVAEHLVKPIIEDDLLAALERVVSGAPLKARDILIIDSDREYAWALKEMLEKTGLYAVRIVEVGHEGLSAIQDQKPDAVILELDLSDMDGYGLLVAMRSHPDLRHIPVLVLTARELSGDEMERLDGDATRYMSKASCEEETLLDNLSATFEDIQSA